MAKNSNNRGFIKGIGGVFVKCKDKDETIAWYQRVLGFPFNGYGAIFTENGKDGDAFQMWSPFPADVEYFGAADKEFMINLIVPDLDSLLAHIEAEGVALTDKVVEMEEGRFAWVTDPNGVRVELWQPPADMSVLDGDG